MCYSQTTYGYYRCSRVSSMVVVRVSSAGLLRLKIPMMSYYPGSVTAKKKSREGADIIVLKMHAPCSYYLVMKP